MSNLVRITSKNQITIPVELVKLLGLRKGDSIVAEEENGRLILTPALKVLDEIAGSVKVPEHLRGKDIVEVIKEARDTYMYEEPVYAVNDLPDINPYELELLKKKIKKLRAKRK